MYITELVRAIETRKIDNLSPGIVKKIASKNLIMPGTKKFVPYNVIESTGKEISTNFKNVLGVLVKDRSLFEGRNDLKIYVRATILKTPEEFKAAEINNSNKQRIKAFIISKRDDIKINESGQYIDFKKEANKSIDRVTSAVVLEKLLSESHNVKQLYTRFINEISDDLAKNFRPMIQPEKRSLKVNVEKKVGEVMAIKLVAPNTSTKSEIDGGTYYEHEPNGPGTFPDYIFHFGKIENEDAKFLRKTFKVAKGVNRISFEAKIGTNIVGKQRSPETFLKNLEDKKIFSKLTGLKIGDVVEINLDELFDILRADGIGIDKHTAYLDPSGKTPQTQVKELKWIADFAPFKVKRNTPGQMAITGNTNKTLFKIEIGRSAYEQGAFKTKE